jgi:hypothetical protein
MAQKAECKHASLPGNTEKIGSYHVNSALNGSFATEKSEVG